MSAKQPSDLLNSLAAYEAWTDARIPTVAAARLDKHQRMAADPFGFLRASYPRWVQRVRRLTDSPPGPVVTGVGDVHVANFGTWRDGEARLVWGINDLDEVDQIPAAHDLLRLAVSGLLAERSNPALPGADIITAVLDGYAHAVSSGGGPVVLDRPDPPPLGPLLPPDHAQRWWRALLDLPVAHQVPAIAREAVLAELPAGHGPVDLRARTAGMGSRDHLRVAAIMQAPGGPVVREIKARTPPATYWLAEREGRPERTAAVQAAAALAADPRRAPDPALRLRDAWVIRRLAPWSDRIELTDLHHHTDAVHLLRAMGAQTAGVHLIGTPAVDLADLTTATARDWFADAADRMLADTVADWHTWRDARPHHRSPR